MATPKMARKTAESIDISYVSLDSLIASLTEARDRLTAAGWTNLQTDMQADAYSNSDREYPYIVGDFMETQEEADAREARETRAAEQMKEHRRAQYEALRNEFEGE